VLVELPLEASSEQPSSSSAWLHAGGPELKLVQFRRQLSRITIFFSASRDVGRTWSASMEISGTNRAVCNFSLTPLPYGGRRKEDQFASPLVGADGTSLPSRMVRP
jgi:hypothetical protein